MFSYSIINLDEDGKNIMNAFDTWKYILFEHLQYSSEPTLFLTSTYTWTTSM